MFSVLLFENLKLISGTINIKSGIISKEYSINLSNELMNINNNNYALFKKGLHIFPKSYLLSYR